MLCQINVIQLKVNQILLFIVIIGFVALFSSIWLKKRVKVI